MNVVAYRNQTTGDYPVTLDQLRASAGLLFGVEPTTAVLNIAGVEPVEATPPPAFNPSTQTLAEGAPAQSGANWVQTWLVTDSPPEPIKVVEVSAAQAKTALYDAGLYDAVEASIAGHPYPPMRIWWASAQVWREDHPYVAGMAAEMGLTDDQVHDLFVAARSVPT